MNKHPELRQTSLNHSEILHWLREEDDARLAELWHLSDQARRANVGNAVHLRGLVEISNYCVRQCGYCGLRAGHFGVTRYRMKEDEILECAHQAVAFGYGTLVMQAGEDYGITREWMAGLIRRIKKETPLAVTLSLGERPEADLAAWRAAGADRYLLRFETSDAELYRRIHPERGRMNAECGMRNAESEVEETGDRSQETECGMDEFGMSESVAGLVGGGGVADEGVRAPSYFNPQSAIRNPQLPRISILRRLRALGYEVGSGVMIGIPGQSFESLARDIEVFRELDLDMIGVGPYIPHPETPLGRGEAGENAAGQVPATEGMTYKVIALTRLVCPQANIPSTTALATINKEQGRELGLMRGANIVMPNLTPVHYRELYTIYPDKACINETAEQCAGCLAGRILSIGRTVGRGPGGRASA